jgi:hypothetical protein
MALQHLRSSTANKRPLPAGMSDGQLAINTNLASPGLFLKNSNGDLVKVGPVHVGTTAPNVSPAAGGETGNTTGELWLDTSLTPNELKTWNGSSWVSATGQEIPVSKLIDGSARQLLQTDAAGTGVEWTSNVDVPGTLDVTSTATFDSIAQHPVGSAGAPTITFTGDTNTGIYSPGADQVAVATNGTGRLFVDASGNIGINTTPSSLGTSVTTLEVKGGSTARSGGLRVSSSDSSVKGAFYIYDGAGVLGTESATPLDLYTGNSPRLSITAAGLVGVGTSSPSAILHAVAANDPVLFLNRSASDGEVARFLVGGNTAFSFSTTAGGIRTIDGGNADFRIRTNSADRLTVTSTGNVGVGTTSPAGILDIDVTGDQLVRFQTTAAMKTRLVTGNSDVSAIEFSDNAAYRAKIQAETSDAISFYTGGITTEAARLDSSGRLLVGTSTSAGGDALQQTSGVGSSTRPKLQLFHWEAGDGAAQLIFSKSRGSSFGSYTVVNSGDELGGLFFQGSNGSAFGTGARIDAVADAAWGSGDHPSRLVFSTTADGASSPTERMRITSGGRILVGITSATTISADARLQTSNLAVEVAGDATGSWWNRTDSTEAWVAQRFYAQGSLSGFIQVNTSSVTYSTTSDHRLKENVTPVSDGISRLQQLKPSRFNFIANPSETVDGFIAHEVQTVVPEAITGTKDAVDDDGNPVYQGIDQSKLVPLLTAALQEAIGRIETLEGMIAVNNITIDEQQHQLSTLAARLTALESA